MENRYVTWTIFAFCVTLAIVIMGIVGGFSISANSLSQDNRVDIGKLQENYKNIEKNLLEIRTIDIKRLEDLIKNRK